MASFELALEPRPRGLDYFLDVLEESEHQQDDLPAFFCPDLDMSTAIKELAPNMSFTQAPAFVPPPAGLTSTERLDLVPSFYTYAVKACLLPIRKVQHNLVTLYFRYIHPTFPVVDECHFNEIHRRFMGHEELLDPADFGIYQAVMAAGFGHLSEGQLQRTFYRTVHAGQEAQFDQVKARYWSQATNDPVALTQICLLISLWSPGPAGVQNNSYWLNRAFSHATAAKLSQSPFDARGKPTRHRLLWWCCLVRDRVLALGMRRPYTLHIAAREETLISHIDFGREAADPACTDLRSKQFEIRAFIWLCRLSEIMASMAIFQQRNRFARAWSGDSVENSAREIERAAELAKELREWQDEFEADIADCDNVQAGQDVPIPIAILRIISNSLMTVLYQPYLRLSVLDRPAATCMDADPLQRMKEHSKAVETSILGLVQHDKSDVLPNWLVSWVTVPLAVYHVSHQVQLDKTPDKVLMPFFNRFMRRTSGAQAIFLVLTRATKECFQKLPDNEKPTCSASEQCSLLSQIDVHADDRDSCRVLEAKVLAQVTSELDYALEVQC